MKRRITDEPQITVRYPPDFDGVLDIKVVKDSVTFVKTEMVTYEFTFKYAAKDLGDGPEDSWATLVRAAQDILAQEQRRRNDART